MTLIIRQIRALITEAPARQRKNIPENKKATDRRKSLSVKISKEPPAIVYFERDHLEDSFECIFDPQVRHDEEKDHPDLFERYRKKDNLKPWQKPPYCSKNATLMNKFKSAFNNKTAAATGILQQSNHSAQHVALNTYPLY